MQSWNIHMHLMFGTLSYRHISLNMQRYVNKIHLHRNKTVLLYSYKHIWCIISIHNLVSVPPLQVLNLQCRSTISLQRLYSQRVNVIISALSFMTLIWLANTCTAPTSMSKKWKNSTLWNTRAYITGVLCIWGFDGRPRRFMSRYVCSLISNKGKPSFE